MKRRRSKRVRGSLVFASAAAAIGGLALSRIGYRPDRLGPCERPDAPLEEDEFRAVTFNAWRLSNPDRIPRLLDALETTASLMANDPGLPELFAVQELESHRTLERLQRQVETSHHFVTCECAHEGEALRSAVGLGINREYFTLEGSRCIELGRVWPDHPRCAVAADLRARDGLHFTAIGTHMAWVFDNSEMSQRLLDALPTGRPLVLLGDFNTWPGSRSYRTLTSTPLRDARPDAPATTPVDLRVDFVFISQEWEVRRELSRRATFEAFGIRHFMRWDVLRHGMTGRGNPHTCPVTDHLPEGVVVRFRRS